MNKALAAPLFRVRLTRNPHGKGFALTVHLRKGAGYRAFDLPGHSMNAAHTVRKHLYIPGFTFTLATNHRRISTWVKGPARKALWVSLRRNGNGCYVPGWW